VSRENRARGRSIGTRIFFLVGLGVMGPIGVLAWAGSAMHEELWRRSRAQEVLLAASAAERASGALASGLAAVHALAAEEDWRAEPDSIARLRAAVRRTRVHHHALFDTFFALDGEGQLLAGETDGWRPDGAAMIAMARRLNAPALTTGDQVGQERLDVIALVPVRRAGAEVDLVVGARIAEGSPRLARLLATRAADGEPGVELRDGDGRRIAAAGGWTGEAPTDSDEVLRALKRAQAPMEGECFGCSGGRGAVWAVAPVGPAHWAVLVWQPREVAGAFERQLLVQVTGATAGLLVLALLFAWGATVSVIRPLRTLTEAAGRFARGELETEVGRLPDDEVGTLGEALEAMRIAVREAQERVARLNVDLERRVIDRTSQLSAANAALAAREDERTCLLRQIISAQEDERKRIARELHDETSQQLAALSMGIDAAASASDDPARSALLHLRALAAETLAEVHRIILDLRPSVLDDLGLQSALEWCADRTLRNKGVVVRIEADGIDRRLPWELETAVFRAAQEALTNVARHSGADTVLVQLQVRDGRLTLEVEDDGKGFDPAGLAIAHTSRRGLGLLGMRERVEVFGGTLAVDSAPGQGTRVRLEIPVPQERRDG
jgi:signal transduction histidine kinase